jgi:hypothetical protein
MTTAILSDFVDVTSGSATISAMALTIGNSGTASQIYPMVFGKQVRFVKFIN